MRKTIFIVSFIGIISCNQKNGGLTKILSPKLKEKSSTENSMLNQQINVDSLSKKATKEIILDSIMNDTTKQKREIQNKLIGVWRGLNNGLKDLEDINEGFIYSFSEDGVLFVSKKNGDGTMYKFSITPNNCENNSSKPNSYFVKLMAGNDCTSSELLEIKTINNKLYLILEHEITYVPTSEFVKLSDNPNYLPKGFE